MSRLRSGRSKPETQRTAARASSRARSRSARSPASSARRGTRVKPPMQAESPLDGGALLPRQGDGALAAEEIGRRQHEHVQAVALDPLAAIVQPAQGADGRIDRDTEQSLEGVDRAHLVRHRTDAADAGRDVGRFARVTAAQQRVEEARRLEEHETQLGDLVALDGQMERAATLDPWKPVDVDDPTLCPSRRHRRSRATGARTR